MYALMFLNRDSEWYQEPIPVIANVCNVTGSGKEERFWKCHLGSFPGLVACSIVRVKCPVALLGNGQNHPRNTFVGNAQCEKPGCFWVPVSVCWFQECDKGDPANSPVWKTQSVSKSNWPVIRWRGRERSVQQTFPFKDRGMCNCDVPWNFPSVLPCLCSLCPSVN